MTTSPPSTPPESALSAAGSASSARRPYPYDLRLRVGDPADPVNPGIDVGLMATGGLVGRRLTPVSGAVPTDQSYESSDVYQERSYVYRWPLLGFGDSTEARPGASGGGGNTPRYAWAENVWFAGAFRGLGPRWRHFAASGTGALPAAEGEHAGFVEALHSAGPPVQVRLFALAGRYVRRWDGPTAAEQALSLDLGIGPGGLPVVAETAARWQAAGVGGQDALYLTDSSARLWRYQSGGWTQLDLSATPGFTLPAGSPDAGGGGARYVHATGPELWRAWGNRVAKCELDPATPGNWTSWIEVGDASVPISGLGDLGQRLVICKADGTAWGLQGGVDTGTARDLTPHLRTTPSPQRDFGKRPAPWLDPQSGGGALYFRSGDSLARLVAPGGAGVGTQPVGPERLADNTTPLRGPITALAGYGGWCAYATQYTQDTATGHLLQYGAWIPSSSATPESGTSTFVEAWNGALVEWPGRRPTSLAVTTLDDVVGDCQAAASGAPAGAGANPVLLAGFADGSYGWCRLPADGPNPFGEGAQLVPADFASSGMVRWPRSALGMAGDTKLYLSVAATGPALDQWRWLEVAYALDRASPQEGAGSGSATWATLSRPLTDQGQRSYFPDSTYGKVLEIEERLRASPPPAGHAGEAAFEALPTPVLATLIVRQQLRPAFRLEYAWISPAHHGLARRDGASDRHTPAQLRNAVVRAAQDPGLVRLVLPYEVAGQFSLVTYQETIPAAGRLRRRGVAFDLAVSAVSYRTVALTGIFGRLHLVGAGGTFGELHTVGSGDAQGTFGALHTV
jgi:hypothetical protein